MTISLEQASEIVKLRKASDIAFFHRLGSLEIYLDFQTGYSLAELRQAEDYDKNKTEAKYLPIIKILEEFRKADSPKNKRILDFGAGIGTLGRYLHEEGYEIETADNQPISVVTAREVNGLISHLITNPEEIARDLQDKKYGLIMLNRVLEQPVMDEETALHLLHTLAPRLEDKGYFLVSTTTGIIPVEEFKRSFERLEKLDINQTQAVRDVYKITP